MAGCMRHVPYRPLRFSSSKRALPRAHSALLWRAVKPKTLVMSSSVVSRHVRCLSTAAAATATATATSTASAASSEISISQAKAQLRHTFKPDKAVEIYSSVSNRNKSPVSSRYALEFTIKRLWKSRRLSDIETLIESHKNDPRITQEPYLSTLIRAYGVAGMFDQALKTYNQMDELGTPRSTTSFNSLLSACNKSKAFDQVPRLFDEMPRKFGFSPDKISYGILVKSYCESGSTESAISTLKDMEERGVEITAITFTTILDALYRNGEREEAERIWDEMVKKGCSPDVAAYNVRLMDVHGGDPETVKALMEEMSNAGLKPDTISYNYLMTCYCKGWMMDEAKKVYRELEENGCSPNAATFRTLIYYLCRVGEFDEGYNVFKESLKFKKFSDFSTLKFLAEGLVKESKTKKAKAIALAAKQRFPPNLLNAWTKLEKDLGLDDSASDSASGEAQVADG